ncbi:ABC transporter permease [Paraburkholderia sp. J12]|uniref:ABC transporter permease n=1 Tax=Paraburkholderia sp. J12 TaxID=2805432 RepID=UPI002ABD9480|nr:ABC transporter permease [Paraburkholderia sp. J12]
MKSSTKEKTIDGPKDMASASLRRGPLIGAITNPRWVLLVPFLLFVGAITAVSPSFLGIDNILQVLRQISVPGLIALGVTFVVICGRLDLSVGALLSLTTVTVIGLHDRFGPLGAIAACMGVGLAVGAVNGILVAYWRLNSLLVTLAMMSIIMSVTRIVTGGKSASMSTDTGWFSQLGGGYVFGIPIPVYIFLGAAVVLSVFLTRTTFGRRVFAVGGNETASEFSGFRSKAVIFGAYLLSGAMTGVAAVILGSRTMAAQLEIGSGYEMNVFAAIILGGTSLLGGAGGIWRTVCGVAVLGLLQNGLLQVGLPYYTQWLVTWAILIVAVWVDLASGRGRVWA